MAWVFLFLPVWLAASSIANGAPGELEGRERPLGVLRRENSSGSLSQEAASNLSSTPGHNNGPWLMWASSGDATGMHHSPSEYTGHHVEMTKYALNHSSPVALNISQSASRASHDPELPESIKINAGSTPAPTPSVKDLSNTVAELQKEVQAMSKQRATAASERGLLSRRPGALSGVDARGLLTQTPAPDEGQQTTKECLTVQCLTGASPTPAPTPGPPPTPLPPTVDNTYLGNGQAGKTTGEMNTNGIWHWGKIVYSEAGNGGWKWIQTPDGDWNLVWVTTNTNNHWRWLMPNRYHWSGHHRRRGTWMHITGPDWRENNHNLHSHMFGHQDQRGGGGGGSDGNWDKGMVSNLVPNSGKVHHSREGIVENRRTKGPRAMPTEAPGAHTNFVSAASVTQNNETLLSPTTSPGTEA